MDRGAAQFLDFLTRAIALVCLTASAAFAQTATLDSYYFPAAVDAALPFPIVITARNTTKAPAMDVVVTIDAGVSAVAFLPDECTAAGGHVVCRRDTLAAGQTWAINFDAIAPDASGALIEISAEIRTAAGASNRQTSSLHTFTTFFVTNTADAGSGSLRAAVEGANAACGTDSFCKIAFRIPPEGLNWMTIRLATPLPAVTGQRISIDGGTQKRYFGGTNPFGPDIAIDGSALSEGSGFLIESACIYGIHDLSIGGFPESALNLQSPPCSDCCVFQPRDGEISDNYLGVSPTGKDAVPNGRGIIVGAGGWIINRNLISGNRRSGLWIDGQSAIGRNVIGLNAAKTAPLGNGASGIYVSPYGAGTNVIDNFIGFNHHAGVSIDRTAYGVELSGNSIQANGSLGIDYGLDGPSTSATIFAFPPSGPGIPHDPIAPGTVDVPTITSAVYDPATNLTTITGTLTFASPKLYYTSYWINVYANDAPSPSGFGEGQYFLGKVYTFGGKSPMAFTLVWPGRPPGPWIAATATANWFFAGAAPVIIGGNSLGVCGDCAFTTTTTEFSRTVRLAP